jgi:radical SAM protein with 4Fe4S-binding SPASM domain
MKKDVFCSLPFTEIFLGPDGDIKTCCSANASLGSLHRNTIEEILQNDTAKKVRKDLLENRWPSQCAQCKKQEEQGARSERLSDREELSQQIKNIDENTFVLKRLDLRWSNTCNLSCVYCYEYFSSKWSDIKGIKINTVNEQNEESLFKFIEKNINNGYMSSGNILLGGEPLLQKQNSRLIDLLSGHGFYILTNLSVPIKTNKIAEKLLNEPTMHWGVSFETVGSRFEYVRRGASWKTFNENIDYVNENKKENSRLEAHSLYSVYSAFNLIEFYEFILEKRFSNVFWNLLESSGNNVDVNVMNMSREMKKRAIKEIDKCQERFPDAPGLHWLIDIKNKLKIDQNKFNLKKNNNIQIIDDIKNIESQLKMSEYSFEKLWPEVYNSLC